MRTWKVVLTALAAAASLAAVNAQTASGVGFAGASTNAPLPGAGLQATQPALLAALDSNHDGVIEAEEIAAASRSLAALDKDKDGKLTPEEYMPVRGASALLAALDANHDGVIDATELANAPVELRLLDKNHDGKLSPDELHGHKRQFSGGPTSPAAPGQK